MNVSIRHLLQSEYYLLSDFLYEAIFIPDGELPPAKEILQKPELQVYIDHFGEKPDDFALAALSNKRIIGLVWARIMNDYGHIDNETPSLAISILEEYREQGIGTSLLREMLLLLKSKGYRQVSLSVQKQNPALRLYLRSGFIESSPPSKESSEDLLMVCHL